MDNSDDQTARLIDAARLIDLERAQIGHEIHDALLPLIFAAAAGVRSLLDQQPDTQAGDDPTSRLRQVANWLDEAMKTGRLLLTEVYPPELSTMSWTAAAQHALQRLLGEDAGVDVRWEIDPATSMPELPSATAAYRIVIEAVRNAVRHGNADVVTVRASANEPTTIQVIDDGIGFDPDQVGDDRFGIRTMRARANLVGGQLKIESGDKGTIVTLILP